MKQNSASRRLGEQARVEIANILLMEISDPRVQMVTVTGCEVSIDRSICKVFVTCAPDRYEEALAGLNSAKGRIRSLLGAHVGWRVTPALSFEIDNSADEAQRIARALKDVPATFEVPKDEFGYPLTDDSEV